ncbi:MAG: hypothetical protein IPH07_20775 [Deltaproteobacteria bacterium]|nr:hypothetical protein [Deltaproteobacteria bacterium]MBK8716149.1 hypothetical protein [Deltaproteobacteria bacterium]MBP7291901.1 hypothetical protein [Nannocystaceae bacterium]
MRALIVFVVAALAWAGSPALARADEAAQAPGTGIWVGLRGGPPKLRTALAAALQTQAKIRGITDRAAVDLVSLQACRWSDLACFVELGTRHGSRVILVGELLRAGKAYELRVTRINAERQQIVAEFRMPVDPEVAAIDTANHVLAGLTGEVAATTPTAIAPLAAESSTEPTSGGAAGRAVADQRRDLARKPLRIQHLRGGVPRRVRSHPSSKKTPSGVGTRHRGSLG